MDTATGALVDRVMGIETEYGLVATGVDGRHPDPDTIARAMFTPVNETHGSTNIFHTNGSRLYLDVGAHPEWATAECSTISQLIAYERAGDVVIDELAAAAEGTSEELAKIRVLKNNTDSQGNSYGCHENYLLSRSAGLKHLSLVFVPFLVTRQLICGAGKIYRPFPGSPSAHYGTGWCVSQRADHVWEGVSSATTRSRPIINTRDEPHADSSLWRRLHVIVGDSSIAEPSAALKVGSTLLALELIEQGCAPTGYELDGDTDVIRDIARDATGGTRIALTGSRTATALEIQRAWNDAAGRWLEKRPDPTAGKGTSTGELRRVHELWTKVLDCIAAGDMTPVARDVDWVIKKNLIDAYAQRHGLSLGDDRLSLLDLTYHDIRGRRGIGRHLESVGAINRWITDDDVAAAIAEPPATTRAALRGAFLRAARDTGAPTSVDWMRVKLTRPEPIVVELRDPFATADDHVDALIELMRSNQDYYRHLHQG